MCTDEEKEPVKRCPFAESGRCCNANQCQLVKGFWRCFMYRRLNGK